MKAVQDAVRAYLQEQTGVSAVADRSLCREYPMLAVAVREDGTVLLAGGKQAEHTYRVTVTAVSDRDRSGNTELLADLAPLLLAGVPMERDGCRRMLHPLDIRTQGEELVFSLELCVPLPQAPGQGETEPELMKTLHVEL